ncbi:class I SAM-dependent methyltransferase [Rehaibacterium terrae]|jgi:phosphatidylethanolamine/phosphatidyl-N-methylethanolamine N-methyltransferase|uniref:Phospholipid N-methyltransferase n=1 Tax=Rehaibacterium terrae TaxID=1341696 RepID=A0A7W8DFE2_9GAMM|nr:methyltransferase domain-containing protein [Rehaibacterium terrae]MBB5016306.1 phospholipid N-methyltransferase [Rehaibacterium terrae]
MDSHPSPLRDEPLGWTFFRQWLKSPLSIAAISPSSRQLARQMVAELPVDARRVIELGGGTGVITQALLDHGIAADQLLVLELNPELHDHLRRRFPQVAVACADACDLPEVARRAGLLADGPADAVVSGLGMLSMPRATQRRILQAAFDVLRPDGRFIQFTYGPAGPVAGEVVADLGLVARRGNLAWWNIPPATVYVYTRRTDRSPA